MGWARFIAVSMSGAMLLQTILLVLISLFAFAKYDWEAPPQRAWCHMNAHMEWVYTRPLEPLIIPLDEYGEWSLTVGSRVWGSRYSKKLHGTELDLVQLKSSRYSAISNEKTSLNHYAFIEDRIGFPFRSARSSFAIYDYLDKTDGIGDGVQVYEGIAIMGEENTTSFPLNREFIAIPLRPIFPGFLLNTLIYSLPFLGSILVLRWVRVVRADRRYSRGKCVSCGYLLEDLVRCPECSLRKACAWRSAVWAGCKAKRLPRVFKGSE